MSQKSLSLRLLGLTFFLGLATGLGSVAGTGCSTPLPGNDVCQDVGYAISNKLFECNGDVDEANDAYERFQATHGCKISDLPTEEEVLEGRIADPPYDAVGRRYECSSAILRLGCEQVRAIAGDYDTFLAASPNCNLVFDRTGTGTLPAAPGSGGAGGAGGGGPAGQPDATMTLNVSWENTTFTGTCLPDGAGFIYGCLLQNGDRRVEMRITIQRFRPTNVQGPPLLQNVVALRLELDGPSGFFAYDPQAHPDDRPFGFSLRDDAPNDKAFRSFTIGFDLNHPASDPSFPAFTASGTVVARNQPCPSPEACP